MTEEGIEIKDIKGIGPKLAERIQETLDIESIEQLSELTEEQLMEVKGIGSSKAEKILSSLEELTKECDRCGKKFVEEDRCTKCTSELEDKVEPIRKEIEYFKNDNFSGKRWTIEKTLEKIDSKLSESKFKEGEELIESAKEELADAQDLSDKLSEIEKMLEEKEVINLSTYKEELDLAWEYMRYGDYEEAINRAEKILDYIEKEKRYQDIETSELLEENIEEFSRHMMGVGARAGEKICGSGFLTLEDAYKAGSEKLQNEADIEESTAKRLIDALNSLFQEIEIKKEHEEETLLEEGQKPTREEEIFRDKREKEETQPESEIEEKEETKSQDKTEKVKKKKVVKKVPKKEKEYKSIDELISMEEEQIEEKERELKHWIPAIIIPIILAIAAYLLFFM